MDQRKTEEWLESYSRSLARQIETKEDFLRQATETIKMLRDQKAKDPRFKEIKPLNDKVWKSLMKRSLIFPERSDPIGLSLANTSLHSRKISSEGYLEFLDKRYELLQEANTNQKAINYNLTKLITSFNSNSTSATDMSTNEVLKEQNEKCWANLQDCVQNELFVAPLSDEDTKLAMDIFHKMIDPLEDPLTVASFQISDITKQLYRVLLRGDMIQVGELTDNGSSDDRIVRLENFTADI
ncbi:inner kinetochore subunit Mcm22p [Monosporozyma unispora]|nr:hypothetical protein C6P44_004319 [Kazachstania unispora]